MINLGKCPKCNRAISAVNIEYVDVKLQHKKKWKGVSYSCPSCDAVLSVGIDPVALKTDTINGVVEELRKKVF